MYLVDMAAPTVESCLVDTTRRTVASVASRPFCPDVRGRTSMLMGSLHNMFTIGHGITEQRGKVAP